MLSEERMVPPHQRRGYQMATYVTLVRYTEQGLKNIKESPSRLEKVRQAFKALGGELKSFHLVQGRYDAILVSEAPNDEVVTRFALSTGSQGNVRTETMRAFTEEEFRKIISTLP
jgi:uncharacterized protein with GYD domain